MKRCLWGRFVIRQQTALNRLLTRIRDFGLPIFLVEKISDNSKNPEV
jgi:hypothetical protein